MTNDKGTNDKGNPNDKRMRKSGSQKPEETERFSRRTKVSPRAGCRITILKTGRSKRRGNHLQKLRYDDDRYQKHDESLECFVWLLLFLNRFLRFLIWDLGHH